MRSRASLVAMIAMAVLAGCIKPGPSRTSNNAPAPGEVAGHKMTAESEQPPPAPASAGQLRKPTFFVEPVKPRKGIGHEAEFKKISDCATIIFLKRGWKWAEKEPDLLVKVGLSGSFFAAGGHCDLWYEIQFFDGRTDQFGRQQICAANLFPENEYEDRVRGPASDFYGKIEGVVQSAAKQWARTVNNRS